LLSDNGDVGPHAAVVFHISISDFWRGGYVVGPCTVPFGKAVVEENIADLFGLIGNGNLPFG
jgi:hypothetical protein